MISNCGHDERNKYKGGSAGDQSKNEWYLRSWYNGGWVVVWRHPDPKVRALIAELAVEAAKNENIGYDQYQRLTFWYQLEEAGYRPANIKVPCEADCSSGVASIVKAVGYILNIQKLRDVNPSMYTGNQDAVLSAAGFQALRERKYLTSESYLVAGDILRSRGHTTIEVSGSRVTAVSADGNISVDGEIGKNTIRKWQSKMGTTEDGFIDGQDPSQKRYWPSIVEGCKWLGGGSPLVSAWQKKIGLTGHSLDGELGKETATRSQIFLIEKGFSCGPCGADGVFGSDSAEALQRWLNS